MFPNWTVHSPGKPHLRHCLLTPTGHYLLPIDEFDQPNDQQYYLQGQLQRYLSSVIQQNVIGVAPKTLTNQGIDPKPQKLVNSSNGKTLALHTTDEPRTFHTFLNTWKELKQPTWKGTNLYPSTLTLHQQHKLNQYYS